MHHPHLACESIIDVNKFSILIAILLYHVMVYFQHWQINWFIFFSFIWLILQIMFSTKIMFLHICTEQRLRNAVLLEESICIKRLKWISASFVFKLLLHTDLNQREIICVTISLLMSIFLYVTALIAYYRSCPLTLCICQYL